MNKNILKTVFIALFAAFICCGSFISIPMPGGVPITTQNLLSILSGTVLGSFYGFISVILFILLGILGLPVFSGMTSGVAIIAGPTGGFLIGYAIGALLSGIVLGSPKKSEAENKKIFVIKVLIVSILAYAVVYIPGIIHFARVVDIAESKRSIYGILSMTLIPFIPGDILKIIVTVPLTLLLRPLVCRYTSSENKERKEEYIESYMKKNTEDAGNKESEEN